MTLGLAYWILMLLWLVLGLYVGWSDWSVGVRPFIIGGNLLLFILLLLLGWQVFGPPLRS